LPEPESLFEEEDFDFLEEDLLFFLPESDLLFDEEDFELLEPEDLLFEEELDEDEEDFEPLELPVERRGLTAGRRFGLCCPSSLLRMLFTRSVT
jgi:hypothetical protein